MTTEPYEDWRGDEHAIGQAVRRHHRDDPSVQVSDLLLSVHRDRLLCRVFATDLGDSWVLKGGTGMLARVPNARTTMDIDLYLNGFDLHRSLSALIEASQAPLLLPPPSFGMPGLDQGPYLGL